MPPAAYCGGAWAGALLGGAAGAAVLDGPLLNIPPPRGDDERPLDLPPPLGILLIIY